MHTIIISLLLAALPVTKSTGQQVSATEFNQITNAIRTGSDTQVTATGGVLPKSLADWFAIWDRGQTLIPDDANTVSHVSITPNGSVFDPFNSNWQVTQPTGVVASPLELAYSITRTNIGPFSDANYFNDTTGVANAYPNFTTCMAMTANSGWVNSPILISNLGGGGGWVLSITPLGQVYLLNAGFAGPVSATLLAWGERQILCFGVAGGTAFIKVDSAGTESGAITYTQATNPVLTIGRFGGGNGYAYNGFIDELWFSSDTPSPAAFDAIYAKASKVTHGGYVFPDTAGTRLHLLGRDFASNSWVAPQATLNTSGTVGSSTFSVVPSATKARRYGLGPFMGTLASATSNYYYLPGGNVFDFTGNFSMCMIVVPTTRDVAATAIYFSSGVSQGNPGWQLVNENSGGGSRLKLFGFSGVVTETVPTPANKANVICWGRSGSNAVLKMNDRPMLSAPVSFSPSGGAARIAMHWDWGQGLYGKVYEIWASTTTPTEDLFTNVVNHVLASP